MKVTLKLTAILLAIMAFTSSCKDDDDNGPQVFPERDRAEEKIVAEAEILAFLQTHFYNYEEFQNPPAGFDYKIVFDTIAGANVDKIPLIDQVSSKMVTDRVKPEVTYTVYYLTAVQGEGASPNFADGVLLSYQGKFMNLNSFDASGAPVMFDLTQVVPGFMEGVVEFNAATGFVENPDGTVTFQNFGVGAVFIPSGLGYYSDPPLSVPVYSQLIFTFRLYDVTQDLDHDGDGIPSWMEDLNGNGILSDDNTDGDNFPNYLDSDDDGDGVPTMEEIIIDEDGNITFPDSNGNGTPDYLDSTYPNP